MLFSPARRTLDAENANTGVRNKAFGEPRGSITTTEFCGLDIIAAASAIFFRRREARENKRRQIQRSRRLCAQKGYADSSEPAPELANFSLSAIDRVTSNSRRRRALKNFVIAMAAHHPLIGAGTPLLRRSIGSL